jgi:diguanylate cyclase (GGDEF)-like protein
MHPSPEKTSSSKPPTPDPASAARLQAGPEGTRTSLLVAGVFFIIGLLFTQALVVAQEKTLQNQLREQTILHAATMRARLESALNSTVFLAQGLVAYIKSVRKTQPENVVDALRAVYEASDRIRNIGLAPGNTLTYIYPLKGNEAALHLHYRDNAAQWPSVQRAMQLRESVLAGPVKLVQGGRGIINRTPVYLSDGSYWGMISVAINLDKLLDDVELSASAEGMRYYLQGDNAGTTGEDAIVGSADILRSDPIRMQITVPGGHWTLMAVPEQGWVVPRLPLLVLRVIGSLLSIFVAGFVWSLLHGRATARYNNAQLALLNEKLQVMNGQLEEVTRQDALTAIANRRAFDENYLRAWAHAQRNQKPVTLLMIDIDHFKQINDTHGHAAGDLCLVEVARRLSGCLRRGDELLARYGGEEFVALSPGTTQVQALDLGERLRSAICADSIVMRLADPVRVQVTISVGVATVVPDGRLGPGDLCAAADAALYRAKKDGRNRVRAAEEVRAQTTFRESAPSGPQGV